MSAIAMCPHCDQDVELDDAAELGETIVCENCETVLEIVSLEPPTLNEFDEEEK